MPELHLTPTRLTLLTDVDAGRIYRYADEGQDRNAFTWFTVTARLAELERAGWVELGYADIWGLTIKGRTVKDGAGGDGRG